MWADELLDIADNGEHVERDALKIKVRQWLMQKMLPQKYGPSGAGVTQMVQVVIAGAGANLL